MKLSLTKSIRACDVLQANIEREILRPDLFALEVPDYKDTNTPPEGEYLPFSIVDGTEKRFWVKADFRTPAAERDVVYYLDVSTGIGGWDALNPQMIMYLNGRMAHGLDVNHRRVMLEPDTDYKSVCYLYSGNQVAHFPVQYRLIAVNKRVEKLYFDMIVPCDACNDVYQESSAEYATVMSALEQACNLLDLRAPGSEDFFAGVERAIEFMDTEFYGKVCTTEGKPTVNCIAHSHIDVEWQWDRRQTREKIQRTASTAVALMKEYPEYRFMLSQPELYRYLKEEAPEKFAEVQALVADGRWEPDGALYLECDCNIISGESMVRQLLYGKKFIKNELGHESRVCFLPDVFGYSAAMPQILKKADVDYFVTSKISWNDTNTMPNDAFIWRGIDGTEIFSAFKRSGYISNADTATTRASPS